MDKLKIEQLLRELEREELARIETENIAEKVTFDLYKSNKKLQSIFNITSDGIAVLDLDTNFLLFNDSYLKMTGYTKEELLCKKCIEITASKDIARTDAVVKEVIEKNNVVNFEKTYILKDGKNIDIDMSLALMPDKKSLLISTRDITDRKKKDKEIEKYVQLIDTNISTSSTDLSGKITSVSEAFCNITKYTKEELIGKNHNIVRHPSQGDELYKDLWKTITANKTWEGEIKNQDKYGNFYWVKASIFPDFDENGKKIGYTSIRQDISDKKRIEEISITDGLTGIYNRRYFNDIFPKVINSAKRRNELISLLIIDIDHFKQYNDNYGHQNGDDVLIRVAKTIKESLHRADDYCFRLGGEEFGVIVKIDTREKQIKFAEDIRINIENLKIPHTKSDTSKYITISTGMFCQNANNIQDMDEIFKDADDLLYEAKNQGRNRVVSNLDLTKKPVNYII